MPTVTILLFSFSLQSGFLTVKVNEIEDYFQNKVNSKFSRFKEKGDPSPPFLYN